MNPKKFVRAFLALIVLSFIPFAHAGAIGGAGAISSAPSGGKITCASGYTNSAPYYCSYNSDAGLGNTLSMVTCQNNTSMVSDPKATAFLIKVTIIIKGSGVAGTVHTTTGKWYTDSGCTTGAFTLVNDTTYEFSAASTTTTIKKDSYYTILPNSNGGNMYVIGTQTDTGSIVQWAVKGYWKF